jgi:hypothetical protein
MSNCNFCTTGVRLGRTISIALNLSSHIPICREFIETYRVDSGKEIRDFLQYCYIYNIGSVTDG